MGFTEVYDYEHGKRDWGSFGLPREGTVTQEPTAGDVARRDVRLRCCECATDMHSTITRSARTAPPKPRTGFALISTLRINRH